MLTDLYQICTKPSDSNTLGNSGMEDILSRLKLNDARKPSAAAPPTEIKPRKPDDLNNLDKLLTNLQDSSKALKKQEQELRNEAQTENQKGATAPTNDKPDTVKSTAANKVDVTEMMRVKQELEAARSVISRQEQELAETRTLKQTI